MPTPAKPCDGTFSEETISLLMKNMDRAQWQAHTCQVCGQQVGAKIEKGRWVPEAHWPSIPRRQAGKLPVSDRRASRVTQEV